MGRLFRFWLPGVAILILILLGVSASDNTVFAVIRQSDGFPTVVTVTGPRLLLERAANFRALRKGSCDDPFLMGGGGFGVDWGDDGRTQASDVLGSDGCPDPLSHAYTVPGTYLIKAALFHMDAGDRPILEWSAETTVTIEGPKPGTNLSLLAPAEGTAFHYQPYIDVSWDLKTDAPVDLSLEFVAENGAVLGSRKFDGLSYAGRGEATVQISGGAYEALMQTDEVAPARLRATLLIGGKEILVRESGPIMLSAKIQTFQQTAAHVEPLPEEPLGVRLFHHTYGVDCYNYIIDWGDGSSPDHKPLKSALICKGGSAWVETTHIYKQPGQYDIKIRTNNYHRTVAPAASPSYEGVTVAVP